jgi:hypothetical protein
MAFRNLERVRMREGKRGIKIRGIGKGKGEEEEERKN